MSLAALRQIGQTFAASDRLLTQYLLDGIIPTGRYGTLMITHTQHGSKTKLLDAALRVVFLIVGTEKAEILRAVLKEGADPPYPSQMVQPRDNGSKLFLVDEAAADLLETSPSQADTLPDGNTPGAIRAKPGRNK